MRKLFIPVLLGVLVSWPLVVPPAFGSDFIGVYFDTLGSVDCIVAPASVPVKAYVLYESPSVPEVLGFEFGVVSPFAGFVLGGEPICGNSPGDSSSFSFKCETPIVCSGVTKVAEFWLMLGSSTHAEFIIVEAAQPENPGLGPVAFKVDGGVLELNETDSLATIDGGHEICFGLPESSTSWGTLKGLYR